MIELSLLKAMSIKTNFEVYNQLINRKSCSYQTQQLLKDFEVYYQQFPEASTIDFNTWQEYFFIVRNPYLDAKTVEMYKDLFNQLVTTEYTAQVLQLLQSLEQQEFYQRLTEKLDKNIDISTVRDEIVKFAQNIEETYRSGCSDDLDLDMDIDAAQDTEDRSKGLRWRCKGIDEFFRGGLIKGDFVLFAGYTNSGKTGTVISEASLMAQQLTNDEKVLYFNTEGSYTRILPRIYCSVLGCSREVLDTHRDQCKKRYLEKMNGDKNRIQIINAQNWTTSKIEEYIKKRNVKLIIFDTLDAFVGYDKFVTKDNSTQKFYYLYQWALNIATAYAPVLVTTQTNRNGADTTSLSLTELRESGVEKQSQANFVIFIGALEGQKNIRYLNFLKDKLGRDSGQIVQVNWDADKTRLS